MPETDVGTKIDVEPEVKDTSQEPVEVTTTPEVKTSTEEQLASKIRDDFEKLYGSRVKQTEDRLHGAYRINEKLQKELDQLKAQVASINKPSSPQINDPWTGIENGQVWKSEIEKLADERAQKILAEERAKVQAETYVVQQQQTLDGAKRQVIAKYPDLDPEAGNPDTPVSKAYVSVLNEHPDWLTNPYGPVLAMYAMEEKLKTSATASSGASARSRSSTANLAPSRPASTGGERMVLTREQKAFCDRHQIKYEDFVKTATALDQGAVEA